MNKCLARVATLGILVSLLAGCNAIVGGQWRSIEPAEVPPEVPRVRQITFQQDGQFSGRMTQQYRTTGVKGTYQFDGTQLILRPEGYAVGDKFTYHVEKIGQVLLLTQNGATNRLCREPAGAAPPAPPALPEGPEEAPRIAVPGEPGQPAPATQSAPASRPAASRPAR
jgi:hypothetical protein